MDITRVAEIIVGGRTGRPGRRASGYRVTATAVITAAHAIGESSSAEIRFDADQPGEWVAAASLAWLDKGIDLAVLTIDERPAERIEPALFGRAAEKDAVLPCSAVGFPRFKLRDDLGRDSQFRDSFHLTGSIALLSNRREGTFEVAVKAPERDPDPAVSPWQGISGAALWSEGRIIGMVGEHHRADGLGRLAAIRVSRWYEESTTASFRVLAGLLELPEHVEDLLDVTRAEQGAVIMERYRAEARQISPGNLVGRDTELADLLRFCAGNEPYQLWRADPWAGKSALASWFVLHPPQGIAVASFFIMTRLAGQSDSDAFTEAMIEQLAFIAGEDIPAPASSAGRRREWARLVESAAARCHDRNVRLVLVIDGLDEDTGSRPSIAALLPRRPSHDMRVIVTSRRSPALPADVPADHPLRRCEPCLLEPSPLASDLAVDAENELTGLLASKDPQQIAILGFLAASGGGLTVGDLAELSGSAAHELSGQLASSFGRSLNSISPAGGSSARRDHLYLFAHEALRETAGQALTTEVPRYLQRIHEWADRYRAAGWPDSTPRYLLRPYGRLLIVARDTRRLLGLATDPRRHDCMLTHLHGDADAVAEILFVQDLLHEATQPDVRSLAMLALYRDRLIGRNHAVPGSLPSVWVKLGDAEKAEAMARSIPEPNRDQALEDVALALAEIGQRDAAKRIAASIGDPAVRARAQSGADQRAQSPADQTTTADEPENWDEAERAASAIADPHYRAHALAALAGRIGELDRDRASRLFDAADAAALQIPVGWRRVAMVAGVGEYMVHFNRAQALARAWEVARVADRFEGEEGRDEDRILFEVLRTLAAAADWDGAEQVFSWISGSDGNDSRDAAARALAFALASAGLWDHAEDAAVRISYPSQVAEVLTHIAHRLADVDHDRAARVAIRAENMARQADAEDYDAWGQVIDDGLELIKALAAAGEWDRAEALAASRYRRRDAAYVAIAEAQTALGLWDRAERTAQRLGDTVEAATALAALAKAIAVTDAARARRIAGHAEQAARKSPEYLQAIALAAVSGALAVTDPGRAATTINEVRRRAKALSADEALPVLATAASAAKAIDSKLAGKLVAAVSRVARTGDDGRDAYRLSEAALLLVKANRKEAIRLSSLAEKEIAASEERSQEPFDLPYWTGPDHPDWAESDHPRVNLACALSALGEWHRAGQIAGKIVASDLKAVAEVALAADMLAHARQGSLSTVLGVRAQRIVATVLAGPHWMAALPAAATIDPATATAVADGLRTFMPHRVRQD